ncbi:MAG: anaerobic ribonucleoside-triphosphate reductase activating protein [Candidatus Omnitrophica bacterium]|nr:anaerobic ribonucleoside-triphosphate reductase activating protein [Candidatus Omnitrophota bacterium]
MLSVFFALSYSVFEEDIVTYPIKGFNPHTFIDWDGMLACVIYLPGCNFLCPFCHSSVLATDPDSLKTVPFEHIERFIKEKKGWIDAMIIGGGEPTLYKQLPDLIKDIKKMQLLVKLDTNGSNPRMLADLISQGLVDYVAMDIKSSLEQSNYDKAAGVSVDLIAIRKSIDILLNSGIDYEFRTTFVPTLVERADIINIAQAISGAKKFVLQQFDPKDILDCRLSAIKPHTPEVLNQAASLAREFVKNCSVRGI